MREYVSPKYLRTTKNAFKKSKGNYTIIHAKQGDTPHKIARREKCTFKQIKQLNPQLKLLKANQKIKKGTRVRIPVPGSKRS